MQSSDAQVRKLMEEYQKSGKIGQAAMKAGMDRKTAAKYLRSGKLPSQVADGVRQWRTREDPFVEDWSAVEEMLKRAPELEAKMVFEYLLEQHPGRYEPGQLRTFQRRVKRWRAMNGPPKEVFFGQAHRPGEAMQTDFTDGTKLEVTIAGKPFPHLLCHNVLPYSNWEWATVCYSKSLLAIKHGSQEAVFQLGRVPKWHQTDNSSAATHQLAGSSRRGFNIEYEEWIRRLGMKPRTTAVGKKEQNGDVESHNGKLKNRLRQHLLLRGHPDFGSVADYETFVQNVVRAANETRRTKVVEELRHMRQLSVKKLAPHAEITARVTSASTIRVKENTYSVPSRLIGERVRVRIYDDRLEVWYGGALQLMTRRLLGRSKHCIDYRHIIWSLVRKPGAFERYNYRDALFPTLTFRKAYDWLLENRTDRTAQLHYLRILHLAASTMEHEVEVALELLLEAGELISSDAVRALVQPDRVSVPVLEVPDVDLGIYDRLLETVEVRP